MRKRYLLLPFIAVLFLGGCQKSSDQFLAYHDMISVSGYDSGNNLSETDFFAKDLVIIPLEDNGEDNENFYSDAALLVNVTGNELVYARNVYDRLYPASLTKLATALVVLKKGELTDTVTIGYNATHIPDPYAKVCGFEEGDEISLDALMHSMLLYSGNDAAIAIAEHLAGSEEQFVKLMNDEASAVGAVNSNFVNSHGLHDNNHYTTAYDIYLIFNELIQYDSFRSIISKASYTAQYKDKNGNDCEKTSLTTNLYLSGDKAAPENISVLGGKSGTTYKAGNCLVILIEDSEGSKYISLILKADGEVNLYSEMNSIFNNIEN